MKATQEKSAAKSQETSAMPFTRANYRWLLRGAAVLVLGYALLLVPGEFVDSKEFSVALYVAPWVIVAGFGLLLYAILKR